ncbi:MAG: hypothetical protein ACP5KA_04710 [Desulfurococcaceae archaeon]
MEQALVLLVLGIVILLAGIGLYAAKKKGGLVLLALGALWCLAMVIYYIYSSLGFYGVVGLKQESAGPLVTTTLGFLILAIGIALAVYVAKRGGKK